MAMTTAILTVASKAYEKWVNVQRQGVSDWCSGADYIVITEEAMRAEPEYYDVQDTDAYVLFNINKPRAILKYLQQYDQVIFMGADVYLTGPIKQLLKKYDAASVILSVHTTAPLPDDGRLPCNIGVHRMGHYNGDFTVWRNTAESVAFLEWQAKQMSLYGVNTGADTSNDQVWLNFASTFIANLATLREPGANVAYYNMHDRVVAKDAAGRWTVNGQLMYFFQFSGYQPEKYPAKLSRYNQRVELQTLAVANLIKEFYDKYMGESNEGNS